MGSRRPHRVNLGESRLYASLASNYHTYCTLPPSTTGGVLNYNSSSRSILTCHGRTLLFFPPRAFILRPPIPSFLIKCPSAALVVQEGGEGGGK